MEEVKAKVRKLLAEGGISEASDIVSSISVVAGDEKSHVGKLVLSAEVALAEEDAAYALKVAKEAWPLAKSAGDPQLQADVLTVMVSALYKKGAERCSVTVLKDALNAVGGTLPVVKEAGDKALEASVHHTHALIHFKIFELGGSSTPDDGLAAEEEALALYKSLNDKKGTAVCLTKIAKAKNMLFNYGEAISAAAEASEYWRAMGKAAGVVAALEVIISAQASLGSSKSGLDAVREELELFKEVPDETNQAILLDYASKVALDMGKTAEAIKLIEQNIEVLDSRGEKAGATRKVLQAAELYHKMGLKEDAIRLATQAVAQFQELGEPDKEAEAKALCEMAQTGKSNTVAVRSQAKLALKNFIHAVESRDISEVSKYEAEMSVFSGTIGEEEMENALNNLFLKDPEALKFMEELGWDCSQYKDVQKFFVWDHNIFYINTTLGGMGFGPQFRSVHPVRKGAANDRDVRCMSATQIPYPHEAWHNNLLMKHGILDSGMQQLTSRAWPPWQ
mmetsp:Transcript_2915/g.3236  ORF Transcript_2915/g.3236 Transcript_2915/m.3236 type:complete len:508 (-) Transcript_2915:111-1634(-)